MTPRLRTAGVRLAILLYAPRSLKLKTACVSSRLSRTVFEIRWESWGAISSGDSTATS